MSASHLIHQHFEEELGILVAKVLSKKLCSIKTPIAAMFILKTLYIDLCTYILKQEKEVHYLAFFLLLIGIHFIF